MGAEWSQCQCLNLHALHSTSGLLSSFTVHYDQLSSVWRCSFFQDNKGLEYNMTYYCWETIDLMQAVKHFQIWGTKTKHSYGTYPINISAKAIEWVPRLHISQSSLTADRDASWQLTQRPKKKFDLIIKDVYAHYTGVWVRSTNKKQLVLLSTTCDLPLNCACLACQRLPASWQWLPTCWCLQKSTIHTKIHSGDVGDNFIINGTPINCMHCTLVGKTGLSLQPCLMTHACIPHQPDA